MIGKARQARLWKHLMDVEKQVGMPLRTEPRTYGFVCPIENFAPDKDSHGRYFRGAAGGTWYRDKCYSLVYTKADTIWWDGLSCRAAKQATNWLTKKLKDRVSNE